MPAIVSMLLTEIRTAFANNEIPRDYRSMLLQTLAMAFHNSSMATLQIIEAEQQTYLVFSNWLGFMDQFRLAFEIRRVIFGLLALMKTPGTEMPQLVQ